MSHLSGLLIVLGLLAAAIEAWPWTLIAVGAVLCWCWRRPQEGRADEAKITPVRSVNETGETRCKR